MTRHSNVALKFKNSSLEHGYGFMPNLESLDPGHVQIPIWFIWPC